MFNLLEACKRQCTQAVYKIKDYDILNNLLCILSLTDTYSQKKKKKTAIALIYNQKRKKL